MAKLSVSIVIGERIAATHFIECDEKKLLGLEKADVEVELDKLADGLERAARERRKKAGK